MSEASTATILADSAQSEMAPGAGEDAFVVEIDGFEGPLDLLLALARRQKIDLARISILALVDQYFAHMDGLQQLRIEIAADHLVMTAWLAFLKSRLLLPEPVGAEEASGEELAAELADRLRQLEAIRLAAGRLMERPQLGRDVLARGAPEGVRAVKSTQWQGELTDLLKAYARARAQGAQDYHVERRAVVTLEEARAILEPLCAPSLEWRCLQSFVARRCGSSEHRRSALASGFAASLELVREGRLDIRQEQAFGSISVRGAESALARGAA
jgi:segregation and condensation protein A